MPQEVDQFVCPCCGMHAPVERLTAEGPFEFKMFHKTAGGKLKLTEEDRRARRGMRFPPGSAHGKLQYEETRILTRVRNALVRRIRVLAEKGSAL